MKTIHSLLVLVCLALFANVALAQDQSSRQSDQKPPAQTQSTTDSSSTPRPAFAFGLAKDPPAGLTFSRTMSSRAKAAKDCDSSVAAKIKCLSPSVAARFFRGLQYQFQITEQPRSVLVGTEVQRNPEHYLWQQTLTLKFSELVARDQLSMLGRINEYLKVHPQTGGVVMSEFGCSDPTRLITCLTKGGGWMRRALMGVTGNLNLSERAAVQQGFLVSDPTFGKHAQLSGGVSFDPAKLFITATSWKKTFDAVLKIDKALAIGGVEDALLAGRAPWQPPWESIFVPKVDFQRKSQFEFLKTSGGLTPFPFPQPALNTLTLSWDLTRVIPDVTSRIDADAVLEEIATAKNKLMPQTSTRVCIVYFTNGKLTASPLSFLATDLSCQTLAQKLDGGAQYQLACQSKDKECDPDDNGNPKCADRGTKRQLNEPPLKPPENACKW